MAIVNASAAQLVALRAALIPAEHRLQGILQRGDVASTSRNAAQLTVDDAAMTALKTALDAVVAA